jgi:hypothetical protein
VKKTALIYDSGDFVHFAQAIAPGFAKTLYFSPWMSSHPHQRDVLVGDIPGLTRVNWFERYLDQADVIVYLDCGDGDQMTWLRKKGYRVWGCGMSDNLELDRIGYRRVLDRLALPTVPADTITGIDELEKYLQKNEKRWIKCSYFRGDFESFHHYNWFLTQPWFEDKKRELGPGGAKAVFLCEEELDGVETGYDGYCIDGQFPQLGFWGWEYKNRAYVIRAQRMADAPACVRLVEALGADLKMLGMRGNFHTEHRIAADGEVYITDPATRLGSPPGEVLGPMISNWADIIYYGAAGELIEPKPIAKYGAQIIKFSEYATDNFISFDIPADVGPLFRFRRAYLDGNEIYWHIPDHHLDQVGSALGYGDTPEEAIGMAAEIADKVKGYQVEHAPDAEDKLLKLIKDGAEAGIPFGGETD